MKTIIISVHLFLFIGLLFVSCDPKVEDSTVYVCKCQEKVKLQEFIKASIGPANNKSDEEMEDVIAELRVTGIKVYCDKRTVHVINKGMDNQKILWNLTPLDSCESVMDLY